VPSFGELDPDLQGPASDLYDLALGANLSPQITSTVRSIYKQATLYERRQHGQWPYPVAPPGRSAHNWGWAFDMTVRPYDALWDLGAVWEDSGYTWGRDSDPVHFELPGASAWLKGASYGQILEQAAMYSAGSPPRSVGEWLASQLGIPPIGRVLFG